MFPSSTESFPTKRRPMPDLDEDLIEDTRAQTSSASEQTLPPPPLPPTRSQSFQQRRLRLQEKSRSTDSFLGPVGAPSIGAACWKQQPSLARNDSSSTCAEFDFLINSGGIEPPQCIRLTSRSDGLPLRPENPVAAALHDDAAAGGSTSPLPSQPEGTEGSSPYHSGSSCILSPHDGRIHGGGEEDMDELLSACHMTTLQRMQHSSSCSSLSLTSAAWNNPDPGVSPSSLWKQF